MNIGTLRPILMPLSGALLCMVLMPRVGIAGRNSPIVEQFVGKAISVVGDESAGRIQIFIERWSNDIEVDSLRAAFGQGGAGNLLPALQQQRHRAGVILLPGVQARGTRSRLPTPKNLLLARQIDTPTGRRVIVASDEHLALGESALEAKKDVYDFSVLDIRFGPDGTGVGKVGGAADVDFGAGTKTLEVTNYASQPVRLIGIKASKP